MAAAKTSRAHAACIRCLQKLALQVGSCLIGGFLVQPAHQRALGQAADLVERGADAHAHYQRRTGTRSLLPHAADHFVDDARTARTRHQHDHAAGVIRAATLQHDANTRHARFVDRVDIGEARCVVACVRTVERRIAHERLAQARRIVSARNCAIDLREHIASHQHVGTHFQRAPDRAGVLADGNRIGAGNVRVLDQMVAHHAPTLARLVGARGAQRAVHVARQLARQPWDSGLQSRRNHLRCDRDGHVSRCRALRGRRGRCLRSRGRRPVLRRSARTRRSPRRRSCPGAWGRSCTGHRCRTGPRCGRRPT